MSDLIKEFEGFSEVAYKCPAGYWTYGYGSRYHADGTPVQQGDSINQLGAEALLNDYLIKKVYPVFNEIKYRLSQCQQDALCSLIYNVGLTSFKKSKLFEAIKNKDVEQIFRQWDWIKIEGKVNKGLVRRRAKELYYFTKDL